MDKFCKRITYTKLKLQPSKKTLSFVLPLAPLGPGFRAKVTDSAQRTALTARPVWTQDQMNRRLMQALPVDFEPLWRDSNTRELGDRHSRFEAAPVTAEPVSLKKNGNLFI